MSASTRFEIQAFVKGLKEVEQLKNTIKKLSNTAKPAALDITKLRTAANKLGRQSDATENELRTQIAVLTDLRANVSLTSQRYRVFTRDIQKAEAALAKAAITSKKSSLTFRGAAKGLGAIAGAGVFGGAEGAIGAGIGVAMGGPTAALAGGAIGAQVGMLRQSISEVAQYNAALERQRKALKLVINDTNRYSESQAFLSAKSKELAIPQDVIVRQFTALTASVKGAGGSVEDAKDAFEAIAAGIRGTGGNLEDMKAAMTATSQVFSKGKVSAEELRQQLGERLPGAFTIFAESMGKTPAELDKALEGGKVTLQDFMVFADKLFAKYGENAKILAQGPEAAGDRLATSMSEFKDALGEILGPIGAQFQTVFTAIVEDITAAIEAFNRFMGLGLDNAITKAENQLARAQERLSELDGDDPRTRAQRTRIMQDLIQAQNRLNELKEKEEKINGETEKSLRDIKGTGMSTYDALKKGAGSYLASIKSLAEELATVTENIFKKMEDQLVQFITKGKLDFQEFASSIIAELTRVFVRTQIMKPLTSWFEGLSFFGGGTTNAKGNVYGSNGIVPFAKGGVVNKPTLFPFSKGTGLMGEAGPEAIMPLKRSQDGRLGVEAAMGRYSGSGSTTVNYTGPVMNFNGDDYVPRSAVTDIINAAANRGASIGEARTLSSLRNSRSRRSNLGL